MGNSSELPVGAFLLRVLHAADGASDQRKCGDDAADCRPDQHPDARRSEEGESHGVRAVGSEFGDGVRAGHGPELHQ